MLSASCNIFSSTLLSRIRSYIGEIIGDNRGKLYDVTEFEDDEKGGACSTNGGQLEEEEEMEEENAYICY
jgi:hypothetical protein